MISLHNIAMKIMYDGTNFHGWQIQPNGITVQEVAEKTLERLLGKKVSVTGCSRTDAGVHAREYVFNFFSDTKIPPEKLPFAFNNNIYASDGKHGKFGDISAFDAFYVKDDFNARFSSLGKRYVYKIHNSKTINPFTGRYSWFFPYELDISLMQKAAVYLEGIHDFSSFMAAGGSQKTTVRNVSKLTVEKSAEWEDETVITIEANAYLYNMVRIITGTLCDVGCKRILPEDIPHIIKSCDRKNSGMTAPPEGLFLDRVFYPENIYLSE